MQGYETVCQGSPRHTQLWNFILLFPNNHLKMLAWVTNTGNKVFHNLYELNKLIPKAAVE